MLQNELKEIRTQLRLAMNGVISTSMREKGIVYKLNFGVPLPEIGKENMDALINGLPNLKAHIISLKRFGQQVVVSLNHFANDNEEEIDVVRKECLAAGVRFAISDGFAKGGEFNRRHANRLMRYRIAAQAVAVLLIVAFAWIRSGGN